jgi:hypothetical protein
VPGSAREVWIGVETHKDVNVAAAVDEAGRTIGDGALASIAVPTTPAGNAELNRPGESRASTRFKTVPAVVPREPPV